ncbi:hypothetical protein CFP56_034000 [Quercus suber]|uniref:Uncharacterized protein n=1 Tax=Quercus suber TaxID=58331 RepID=A0AAW0JFC9_QUESU
MSVPLRFLWLNHTAQSSI